jgi:hypothetical protein
MMRCAIFYTECGKTVKTVKAVRTGAENQFNTLYTVHLFVSYVFNLDDEKDLWCRFFTPEYGIPV